MARERLSALEAAAVQSALARSHRPVTLRLLPALPGFTPYGARSSRETRDLLHELAGLSNRLTVIEEEPLPLGPVTELLAGEPARSTGLRFWGLPGGHQLLMLIEAIGQAGRGEVPWAGPLAALTEERHIYAFTSPT